MTDAQRAALVWLMLHGGEAACGRNWMVTVLGMRAPFGQEEWQHLLEIGMIERETSARVRLTEHGRAAAAKASRDRSIGRELDARS